MMDMAPVAIQFGVAAGGSMRAAFVIVRWFANFVAGRLDRRGNAAADRRARGASLRTVRAPVRSGQEDRQRRGATSGLRAQALRERGRSHAPESDHAGLRRRARQGAANPGSRADEGTTQVMTERRINQAGLDLI